MTDDMMDQFLRTPGASVTMNGLSVFGPPVRGRSCGSCTACCTQVPVVLSETEHKPANTRCKHLCSKGCRIYETRPRPCVAWSCRWLFDQDTAELRRPDQSGYVIDCATDTVLADGQPVHVVQVWVDPKRRDAHRDPALRRYLALLAVRHNLMTIVRWSSEDGMALLPPAMNETGEWIEFESQYSTAEDMAAKLAAAGVPHRNLMTEAGR